MMSLDYNNPETWCSAELHAPPPFDAVKYQSEIDKIFGTASNGLPIVRLVWAGDIKKTYSKFYVQWTSAGFGLVSELRAKYKYASIQIPGTPDVIDIPPPRWILEDREDPARYMESWNLGRWSADGRELRPEAPTTGYYSHLHTIAEHDSMCCKRASKKQVVCWGKYRVPDNRDLEMLKRAKYLRDKDAEVPLDQPLSEKVLASAAYVTNERMARKEAMADQELREYVDENALELIEAFTGIKLSEKTKKFSIPKNFSRKESGLITPVH